MALGTTSLVSNTVYALSDAATQFSNAAHKVFLLSDDACMIEGLLTNMIFYLQGIVAFTFDDQSVARMEKQQKGVASHSKGVINEVIEVLLKSACILAHLW